MAKGKGGGYPVGYKKPPRHTQFRKGKSGNPKGRPRKVQTLSGLLWAEARTRVEVTANGESKKASLLEVIIKQLLNKAAKGDVKAFTALLKELKASEPDTGDNLRSLLTEFRAIHDQHVSDEGDRIPRSDQTVAEKK